MWNLRNSLTDQVCQAFDDGAHLLGAGGGKLKAELDNDDGGGLGEGEVGQHNWLLEVAGCRQQRGAPQSDQHLDKNVKRGREFLAKNIKSHFVNCAAFKVSNKSKRGDGRLRVFEAAMEEVEVGRE